MEMENVDKPGEQSKTTKKIISLVWREGWRLKTVLLMEFQVL